MMRPVAEWLVLRGATATQRRAESARLTIYLQLTAKCIRTRFADACEIDRWCRLIMRTVLAPILNRTGGAGMRDFHDTLHLNGIRVQPRALDVCEKHRRSTGNAKTRMNAPFGFKENVNFDAFTNLDTVPCR